MAEQREEMEDGAVLSEVLEAATALGAVERGGSTAALVGPEARKEG